MIRPNKKVNLPKIIIYELNEVPRRLIDFYIEKSPNSAFAEIIRNGIIFNTFTNDNGELHPWSTWPTVHRGVDNRTHNIRYINQDLNASRKYKPIWELLNESEIDVGVFGSLQSFPPKSGENYKFYLPDTFSPSPEAYPKELSIFQLFNLTLTGENKAISRKISKKNIADFIYLLAAGIISKSSALAAFIHILKENINPKYKSRRSTIQNVLSFSLYLKYLKKHQPTFSTYFTNHVAGMMHRYWKYLFPSDFNLSQGEVDSFHSKSILKAMDLADKNLRDLLNFADKKNYNIFIISSMGQASIKRADYIPELVLRDFEKFIDALGLNKSDYKLLPAMQPDYCVDSINNKAMNLIRNAIKMPKDTEGNAIIIEKYAPVGLRLNLSLNNSYTISRTKKYILDGVTYDINMLGFELIERDLGTAYHIPEGIFAWYGNDSKRYKSNKKEDLDTCRICPTILELYGINIPDYMKKPLSTSNKL